MVVKEGKIIIIVAPSGAGKSTLMKRIREDFDDLTESVSFTTRDRRPNEEEGVDYHFISQQHFQDMVEAGDFIEWALVHGQYKGTSKSYVERMLSMGSDLIFDLDIQGADAFKEVFGDRAQAIFIEPPSFDELKFRLRNRGTDSKEAIKTRLENAKKELARKDDYDFAIVNDDIDSAYEELQELIINLREDG